MPQQDRHMTRLRLSGIALIAAEQGELLYEDVKTAN